MTQGQTNWDTTILYKISVTTTAKEGLGRKCKSEVSTCRCSFLAQSWVKCNFAMNVEKDDLKANVFPCCSEIPGKCFYTSELTTFMQRTFCPPPPPLHSWNGSLFRPASETSIWPMHPKNCTPLGSKCIINIHNIAWHSIA